jgi:hypothetical protein
MQVGNHFAVEVRRSIQGGLAFELALGLQDTHGALNLSVGELIDRRQQSDYFIGLLRCFLLCLVMYLNRNQMPGNGAKNQANKRNHPQRRNRQMHAK